MKYLMIFLLVLCAAACDAQLTLNGNPPNGDRGQSYSYTFSATGGTQPYTFSVNPAPDFLSMNPSTGELSGTLQSPVIGDTYTFDVSVTDAVSTVDTRSYTITVNTGGGKSDSGNGGCSAEPSPFVNGWLAGLGIGIFIGMLITRLLHKNAQ